MLRPQRHRLLHGYPMAPLLVRLEDDSSPHAGLALDPTRPLIIGVLPHTFCNPQVRGCGFCTFPHEPYDNRKVRRVVDAVIAEVQATAKRMPGALARRVDALYFGGGTANLTPPESLDALARAPCATFELGGAEVTLEGVPSYFLTRDRAALQVLSAMPVRHRRISVGIQTFDPRWLARMGRQAFGDATAFRRVVDAARQAEMTTSCDLLFNLPGQGLAAALEDVRLAVETGFDQVCVYNLVLSEDVGSAWAHEKSLLGRMNDTQTGCRHWLEVRQLLLDSGYVQTTLTNFERHDVHATERRFVYERASFAPQTYDALGFGAGAISTFTSRDCRSAVKWMNAETADAFVQAVSATGHAASRSFFYTRPDMQLLIMTRQLAALAIDRADYTAMMGSDAVTDFPRYFETFEEAGLLHIEPARISLTPEGMFFADAVAGLLAAKRADQLRGENDSRRHSMG
jgi:oxygen-independent coproporphyrinogen-3 oxidase